MATLYDKSIEAAILGICLLEPAAYFKTTAWLSAHMFYVDDHQTTYTAIKELADKGIEIDLLTVTFHMERTKKLTSVEPHQTAYFLCRLTNAVTSSAHLHRWCIMIKHLWQDREIQRMRPQSVEELQQATKMITGTVKKNNKITQYRFLLNLVDKRVLRPSISKLGARVIKGHSPHTIKVSSPLLAYLMWVCEPKYTWTCGDNFTEELTNEECKNRLPKDAILTPAGWICKTNQFPVTWR